MTKTSDAKREYIRQYDRERTVMVAVKLNRATDADIIARLGAVDNRAGYIKELIRADINRTAH